MSAPKLSLRINSQQGIALLEVLIAILVFSVGVLGLIAFQGSAMSASQEARSRSESTLFANQIIGELWSGDRTAAGLQTTVDNRLVTWNQQAAALLPNGTVSVSVSPVTTTINGRDTVTTTITVTLDWRGPQDSTGHELLFSTAINNVDDT